MDERSPRTPLAWLTRRRRLLRDLRRRAEWVEQARATPPLRHWLADAAPATQRPPAAGPAG